MKKLTKKTRIHNCEIPVIGLTGGIATGKSTVANYLMKKGFTIICADQLIKNIYQQPQTIQFISSSYPQVINDNQINFKKLRELFFKDNLIQQNIEDYLYSKIDDEFIKCLPKASLVIYDAPVLFEKKLDKLVDSIICVYATPEIQLERLINRDKISLQSAQIIIQAQLPIDDKKSKSDFIINNCGSLEEMKNWLDTSSIVNYLQDYKDN